MHASNKDKVGLVLSGGLFRNAFQVGALEALYERNFQPDVIVGVSSGAWNGACLAAGQIKLMRKFWTQTAIMPKISLRNVFFNKTIFNLRYIVHEIPKRELNFNKILNNNLEFYVGTTRLRNLQPHFFCNQETKQDFFSVLMASNWIPFLYPWPVSIQGSHYIDGGFTDKVPYEKAFLAGCSQVYIIVPDHGGRIFKKPWQRKTHQIPPQYQKRTTIVAPSQPLHPFCTKQHQIEEAMEKGYHAGQKIPFQ